MSTPPEKQIISDETHDNSNTDIINKLESECLEKDLERIKLANTMLKNENTKLISNLKQKDYTIELKDQQISVFHKSEQYQYQTQLYETQQQLTYYFNESIRQNSKIQQLMISIQSIKFDHQQKINELNNALIRAQKLKFRQTNINNSNVPVENTKLFEENLKLKQMIKELEDVNGVRLNIISTLKKQNEMFCSNETICQQKCDELQQQLLQKNEIIISANDENIWLNGKIKQLEYENKCLNDKLNGFKTNQIKKIKLVSNEMFNKCNEFNQLINNKEMEINKNINRVCGKIKHLQSKVSDYKNGMGKQIKKEKLINNEMELCIEKKKVNDITANNGMELCVEKEKLNDIKVNNGMELCVAKGVKEANTMENVMELKDIKVNNNAKDTCDKTVVISNKKDIVQEKDKKKKKKKNKKKRTFEQIESNNKLHEPLNKRRKVMKKKKEKAVRKDQLDVNNKLNVLWTKDDLVTDDNVKVLERDNIYVVEKILSHKVVNKTNKYKYKVKWYGYDAFTWEPECHLNPYTVTQYWQKQKQ